MAATEKGVWDLQEVRDKQLTNSWPYTGAPAERTNLYVWGANANGTLGLNEAGAWSAYLTAQSSPIQIPGTWSTFSTGSSNTGGVKADGTLWMWGDNGYGQLGLNEYAVRYSSPVQIGSDTTWSSVSGGDATVAIKTDGTLWVWGSNNRGQLGLNQNAGQYAGSYAKSSPTQVGSETTWSQASSGTKAMGAVKTDGTLWLWGQNDFGRLGQNQAHPGLDGASSPVQIPGTNWQELSMGDDNALALKTDGTIWSWGYNFRGTLGLNQGWPGSLQAASSPTQIPGTDWISGFKASTNTSTLIKEL